MAKTLKQLENGIRIKYLVKPKKYYLFFGSAHIKVNMDFIEGFKSEYEAKIFGERLSECDKIRGNYVVTKKTL